MGVRKRGGEHVVESRRNATGPPWLSPCASARAEGSVTAGARVAECSNNIIASEVPAATDRAGPEQNAEGPEITGSLQMPPVAPSRHPIPRVIHPLRQRAVLGVVLVIVLAAGVMLVRSYLNAGKNTFGGVVRPQTSVALRFKNALPLQAMLVSVGQRVRKGQVLARQDAGSLTTVVAAETSLVDADSVRFFALKNPSLTPDKIQQLALQVQRARQEAQAVSQSPNATAGARAAAQTAITLAQNAQASTGPATTADQLASVEAQSARDRVQLDTDAQALATLTIISPIDGVVTATNGEPGELVGGNLYVPQTNTQAAGPAFSLFPPPPQTQSTGSSTSFTPVIAVAGTASWQVVAPVPETAIRHARLGSRMKVTVNAFPHIRLTGTVVAAEGTPITVNGHTSYNVILAVSNPPVGLLTGMTTSVTMTGS